MTSNQASGKTTARQIRIVGVVVFGAFLALLNQTVMSPALPAIMADFGIDASTAQWIMSIYPLVSGIMVPVSAFLIDRFSTRVLFFAATAAFAAGTALCAAAPTFFLLICGRVLQAAASGVLLPLVSVVPMLVFPVEKRGTAMGVAGIVMSAGPAVGPVLGGAIIDAYGWRVTLGCIVPLALAVLLCGVFLLENVGEAKRPKLDVASIALSTIAFGGLLYGFSSASTLGWTSIAVLGTIIAGIVCLIAFVKRQLTLEEPLLDLRCLKSSDFAVAAIVVTLINAACLVTNILLPILLQTAMGASALETGIVMLPAAAAGILISPISGIVFDKFGPRTISVGGLVLMTATLFALSRMNANSSIVLVAVLCAAQAVGQSLLANMPVNTWGINALPNDKIAHGNAIANTGRQVAGGLGTALVVTLMTSITASSLGQGMATEAAERLAGTSAAYMACAAIGLVALIFGVLKIRNPKRQESVHVLEKERRRGKRVATKNTSPSS